MKARITIGVGLRLIPPSADLYPNSWWFSVECFVKQLDMDELLKRSAGPWEAAQLEFVKITDLMDQDEGWLTCLPAPLPVNIPIQIHIVSTADGIQLHQWKSPRKFIVVSNADELQKLNAKSASDQDEGDWEEIPPAVMSKSAGVTFAEVWNATIRSLAASKDDPKAKENFLSSMNFPQPLKINDNCIRLDAPAPENYIYRPDDDKEFAAAQSLHGYMGCFNNPGVDAIIRMEIGSESLEVDFPQQASTTIANLFSKSRRSATGSPTELLNIEGNVLYRTYAHWVWQPLSNVIEVANARTGTPPSRLLLFSAESDSALPQLMPDGHAGPVCQFTADTTYTPDVAAYEVYAGTLRPHFEESGPLFEFLPDLVCQDALQALCNLPSGAAELELIIPEGAHPQFRLLPGRVLQPYMPSWRQESPIKRWTVLVFASEFAGSSAARVMLIRRKHAPVSVDKIDSKTWRACFTGHTPDPELPTYQALGIACQDAVNDVRVSDTSSVVLRPANAVDRIEISAIVTRIDSTDAAEQYLVRDRWNHFMLKPEERKRDGSNVSWKSIVGDRVAVLPQTIRGDETSRLYRFAYRRQYDQDPKRIAVDWRDAGSNPRWMRLLAKDGYGRSLLVAGGQEFTAPNALPSPMQPMSQGTDLTAPPLLSWRFAAVDPHTVVLSFRFSTLNTKVSGREQGLATWQAVAEAAISAAWLCTLTPLQTSNEECFSQLGQPQDLPLSTFLQIDRQNEVKVDLSQRVRDLCLRAIIDANAGVTLRDAELSFRIPDNTKLRSEGVVYVLHVDCQRQLTSVPFLAQHGEALVEVDQPSSAMGEQSRAWFDASADKGSEIAWHREIGAFAQHTSCVRHWTEEGGNDASSAFFDGQFVVADMRVGRGQASIIPPATADRKPVSAAVVAFSLPRLYELPLLGEAWISVYEGMLSCLHFLFEKGPPIDLSLDKDGFSDVFVAINDITREGGAFDHLVSLLAERLSATHEPDQSLPLNAVLAAMQQDTERIRWLVQDFLYVSAPAAPIYGVVHWNAPDAGPNKSSMLNRNFLRGEVEFDHAESRRSTVDATKCGQIFTCRDGGLLGVTKLIPKPAQLKLSLSAARAENLWKRHDAGTPELPVVAVHTPGGTKLGSASIDLPAAHQMRGPRIGEPIKATSWSDPKVFENALPALLGQCISAAKLREGVLKVEKNGELQIQAYGFSPHIAGSDCVSAFTATIHCDPDLVTSNTPWCRDSFSLHDRSIFVDQSAPVSNLWWEPLSAGTAPDLAWRLFSGSKDSLVTGIHALGDLASSICHAVRTVQPMDPSEACTRFYVEKPGSKPMISFDVAPSAFERYGVVLARDARLPSNVYTLIVAVFHSVWRQRDLTLVHERDLKTGFTYTPVNVSPNFAQRAPAAAPGIVSPCGIAFDAASFPPASISSSNGLDAFSFLSALVGPDPAISSREYASLARWLADPQSADLPNALSVQTILYIPDEPRLPVLQASGSLAHKPRLPDLRADGSVTDPASIPKNWKPVFRAWAMPNADWSRIATDLAGGLGRLDLRVFRQNQATALVTMTNRYFYFSN